MNLVHASGTRKKAVARATLRPGNGTVRINSMLLTHVLPVMYRTRIEEPLILAGAVSQTVDINVSVHGGGKAGMADATRLAIAKCLSQFDTKLQKTFLDYDRTLLVADVRQRESRKPNTHGKARSKRQKSYR